MDPEFLNLVPLIAGVVALGIFAILAMTFGTIYNTRYKIKHGYPLEGMWGQSLKPELTTESMERVKLLSQENAQLRAELGAVKDRLANVERIVTDSGYGLTQQIESLRQQPQN
jgi:hypothetical protein